MKSFCSCPLHEISTISKHEDNADAHVDTFPAMFLWLVWAYFDKPLVIARNRKVAKQSLLSGAVARIGAWVVCIYRFEAVESRVWVNATICAFFVFPQKFGTNPCSAGENSGNFIEGEIYRCICGLFNEKFEPLRMQNAPCRTPRRHGV